MLLTRLRNTEFGPPFGKRWYLLTELTPARSIWKRLNGYTLILIEYPSSAR